MAISHEAQEYRNEEKSCKENPAEILVGMKRNKLDKVFVIYEEFFIGFHRRNENVPLFFS